MKKLLALALVLALALSCLSFASAEETAPDTYSTIDGFEIWLLPFHSSLKRQVSQNQSFMS